MICRWRLQRRELHSLTLVFSVITSSTRTRTRKRKRKGIETDSSYDGTILVVWHSLARSNMIVTGCHVVPSSSGKLPVPPTALRPSKMQC